MPPRLPTVYRLCDRPVALPATKRLCSLGARAQRMQTCMAYDCDQRSLSLQWPLLTPKADEPTV
jgi:hypothetical protein